MIHMLSEFRIFLIQLEAICLIAGEYNTQLVKTSSFHHLLPYSEIA